MKNLLPILALLLASCGTTGGIVVANFLESPANQRILTIAANAGAMSIVQSTGKSLSPDQQDQLTAAASAVLDAGATGVVWAAGEALRTKQSTGTAAAPGALTAAMVSQGGLSQQTALPIAGAVRNLVATGVPADTANESVARTVQSVAAQTK